MARAQLLFELGLVGLVGLVTVLMRAGFFRLRHRELTLAPRNVGGGLLLVRARAILVRFFRC